MEICLSLDCITFTYQSKSVDSDFALSVFGYFNSYQDQLNSSDYYDHQPDKKSFSGITYHHKILGQCGNICQYSTVDDTQKVGRIRVTLQGSYLKMLSLCEQLTLLDEAEKSGFKITRFDNALDLYATKEVRDFAFHHIQSIQKTVTGFGRVRDGSEVYARTDEYASKCLYFGSKNSDKILRIYDKELESKGEFPTLRFELQYRQNHAHSRAVVLLEPFRSRANDSDISLCEQVLKGYHLADYNFPDDAFWLAFRESLDSAPVKVSIRKKDTTLLHTAEWIARAVAPSLAKLLEALGDRRFYSWLQKQIRIAKHNLSSRSRIAVESFKWSWWEELGLVSPSSLGRPYRSTMVLKPS